MYQHCNIKIEKQGTTVGQVPYHQQQTSVAYSVYMLLLESATAHIDWFITKDTYEVLSVLLIIL